MRQLWTRKTDEIGNGRDDETASEEESGDAEVGGSSNLASCPGAFRPLPWRHGPEALGGRRPGEREGIAFTELMSETEDHRWNLCQSSKGYLPERDEAFEKK